MKKTALLFVFSLLIGFCFAQKPENFTGSLLWKVSGNGLEKPSYVFGTYHLLGKELIDSVPALQTAIDATVQTVGEVDMKEMEAAAMQMMLLGMMPQDQGYKEVLSEEKYTLLDEALKEAIGVGLDQMGMLNPSMIGLTLISIIYMQMEPEFNPQNFEAIDAYLQRISLENEKPILGLETTADQMKLLFETDEPIDTQVDALICSLQNMDYQLESGKTMKNDYLKGDLYKMYMDSFHNSDVPCAEYTKEEDKDAMLKDRNDKWIAQLPSIMKENPSLIAVGAAHLAGEEGVLYQLSQLGYKIEAVK